MPPHPESPSALPRSLTIAYPTLVKLGDAFTAINAAVGPFGLDTLAASTKALKSASPGDATYTRLETALAGLGERRDGIVAAMKAELYGAAAGDRPVSVGEADALIRSANRLLASAAALLSPGAATDSGPSSAGFGYERQMRTRAQSSPLPTIRCMVVTSSGAPDLKPATTRRSASPSRRAMPSSMSRRGASTMPSV